ncbi:MAG: glycogen debranching enzyme N-terminal domain-containing protein [Clostridia bacterium]|nr:glycogen debranching enzyme N-terminal domain-containing protein [Clostridia bacterium]
MEFGKSHWRSYDRGIEKEWLLTNGIGGFASSTVIGANTRRYHGLLVASLNPPVGRHLILSKIDESIIINGVTHNFYSFQTPDFTMEGFRYQQRFVMNPLPTFIYSIEDVFIEKKVCMVYGQNTTAVIYNIINGSGSSILRLTPLVNFRDYHFNSSRQHMIFDQIPNGQGVAIKPYNLDINIKINCSEGAFVRKDDRYFLNMDYAIERERGLQSTEDHFIPGYFEVEVKPGEEKEITVTATIEKDFEKRNGSELVRLEIERLNGLLKKAGYKDDFARKLVLASDNFIVKRASTGAKTIIAGYPWFTDWGRDSMIALTGLTLATRRYEDAREILYTFSKYEKYGLLPNVFPDGGDEPPYNSVDASLWYFEAVNKYLAYTGDSEFVFEKLYETLTHIINSYINGTLYKIKMDEDYLIAAGDEGTQLTWMDAKVGSWVVTPRHGKAVEINALWYNALKVFADIAKKMGKHCERYEELAERVRESFVKSFWNYDRQCLYDVITEDFKDSSVRPNQILAVSLSYPVLAGDMAKKVVTRVWKELYTAYGLRSLSKRSANYIGTYFGDQHRRDGAYHQGTVWTWPLGHFITAFVRVNGGTRQARLKALRFIEPFRDHLRDACVGSISEIFDGDEPHVPRGCFAQAWSVAEILRAYTEDVESAIYNKYSFMV